MGVIDISDSEFIAGLQNPKLYNHPVINFSLIETHISWVLLTGCYAYKIKKPVNLGFLDFSTLEKRRFYCLEELRLNRRFAPDLYIDVVGIRGSHKHPRLDGCEAIIEYAVKMREFPQACLMSTIVDEHRLKKPHVDSIAQTISKFHLNAEVATANSQNSIIDGIALFNRENFETLEFIMPEYMLPEYYQSLKNWCFDICLSKHKFMLERIQNGFIRECHGDLHLGNIALIDGQVTLFDCVEFNPQLRWLDTISEIAFVAMDLCARGYSNLAWRFINHYSAATGDYNGISLLQYYIVYRALVRSKIEALRETQEVDQINNQQQSFRDTLRYLDLAWHWKENSRPAVIVMHGLSGSGKSTIASQLSESLGGIQIRSDVERKRLFNLNPLEHSDSSLERGIYTSDATFQTYTQLAMLTDKVVKSGITVIVDASFLKRCYRNQFKRLARKAHAAYIIISCNASIDELRDRISRRSAAQNDPSEANLEVLEQQLEYQDQFSSKELKNAFTMDCSEPRLSHDQLQELEQQIEYQNERWPR